MATIITHSATDSIFDSDAQVLVNTVNTVGVMGKGLALAFKQRYPEIFVPYKAACDQRKVCIGRMFFTPTDDCRYVCNFPTKEHWRNPSKLIYIDLGLDNLIATIILFDIKSVAIPALGCTNGGLEWAVVREMILDKFSGVSNDILVDLYPPQ